MSKPRSSGNVWIAACLALATIALVFGLITDQLRAQGFASIGISGPLLLAALGAGLRGTLARDFPILKRVSTVLLTVALVSFVLVFIDAAVRLS